MSNEIKIERGTIVRRSNLWEENFGIVADVHTNKDGSQQIAIFCPVRAYGNENYSFDMVAKIYPLNQHYKGWTIAEKNSYRRASRQFLNPENYQVETVAPRNTKELIAANMD